MLLNLFLSMFLMSPEAGAYTLFSSHKSDYSIVLSSEASESETFAASELQKWLGEVSGVTLPVVDEGGGVKGKRIIVGYGKDLSGIMPGEGKPSVSDESFRYCSVGGDIAIWGGARRGTMYGVYSFLENELGCRWYTKSVSVAPSRKSWSFRVLDHSESPAFAVRNVYYKDADDDLWAARNKNNGISVQSTAVPVARTGGAEYYWGVHTFNVFVPVSKYFETHPEYFSLRDGKRTSEKTQLCLSNPEVLQLCVDGLRKVMRKRPEFTIYDLSQNDNGKPCQCEKCRALVKKYGSQSGAILHFVNQVADSLKEEFPDKFIGTLAYQYSVEAPVGIKPRDNVVVRLCTDRNCHAHSIDKCSSNKTFKNTLSKWSQIAKHLFIWDYVVSFSQYLVPFPNFQTFQPNLRLFSKSNVIGVMEQANYQSSGGELAELRAYVLCKLLWDTEEDVDALVNDFISGYYGPGAGKFVRQYYDNLCASVNYSKHMLFNATVDDSFVTPKFINDGINLFAKAKAAAGNDEYRKRVELAELTVLYSFCISNPEEGLKRGYYDSIMKVVEREGITHLTESKKSLANFTAKMDKIKNGTK